MAQGARMEDSRLDLLRAPIGESSLIFRDVVFSAFSEPQNPEELPTYMALLETHGAKHCGCDSRNGAYPTHAKYGLTHVIADPDAFKRFPDLASLPPSAVSLVTWDWVVQSVAKKKMLNTRAFHPDPALIFRGILLHCAEDLPEGDRLSVQEGVVALGGSVAGGMTKMVTHVVALSMEARSCQLVKQANLRCSIVLPHWFDECLRLGRRLDETPFKLPGCAFLSNPNYTEGSSDLALANELNASSFKGRVVMLGEDLGIGVRLRSTLEHILVTAEASVTQDISACDVFICRYRDGEYVKASQSGKEVGNFSWLFRCMMSPRWTSPLDSLLYYPIPRDGVPGFAGQKISISNYQNDARLYLEMLIRALGAEYTPTMRQDNTHLITSSSESQKYEAAREWNVDTVNHFWLEDSYSKCAKQSLTRPRYTEFPPDDLPNGIFGQGKIDLQVAKRLFFPPNRPSDEEGILIPVISQGVDSETEEDVDFEDATNGIETTDVAMADAPIESERPAIDRPNSADLLERAESLVAAAQEAEVPLESAREATDPSVDRPTSPTLLKRAAAVAGAAKTPKTVKKPAKAAGSSKNTVRTPAPLPKPDGKENQTPITGRSTGGRAAKAKAAETLLGLASDIALFQKESKRAGGVIHGGRKQLEMEERQRAEEKAGQAAKKRKADAGAEDDAEQPMKKTKKEVFADEKTPALPPIAHRLMVSGHTSWAQKPQKMAADKTLLRSLGVKLTENPHEVTILAAPKLVRTRKFVAALAAAPRVVSIEWLDHCLREKELPSMQLSPKKSGRPSNSKQTAAIPTYPFALVDEDGEARFEIKLADSLRLAAKNKGGLLSGWRIHCTEQVTGGFDTFNDIIRANGGACALFKPTGRGAGTTSLISASTAAVLSSGTTAHDSDDSDTGSATETESNTQSSLELMESDESARRKAKKANDGGAKGKWLYLLSGESEVERALWRRFADAAAKEGKRARVVKAEWLLHVAMAQEMVWKSEFRLWEAES